MATELFGCELGTVLVVDDDAAMRRALRATLTTVGFQVMEAARGEEAISVVRVGKIDAVLLDVEMPGMGGLEACRSMRRVAPGLPILMLTVVDGEDDKVLALESGADDYITKPFQLRETIARVRSAIRRGKMRDVDREAVIRVGRVELDPARYRVTRAGKPIHVTPKEFELLHYLMLHAGEPIRHARLLKAIWGPDYGNELEYLRTFVRSLRKKLEDDPADPQYLLTEPYIGYRFNDRVPMA